jgi:hypothetical protein
MVEALRAPVHNIERIMLADLDRAEADALRTYLDSCRRSLRST